MICASGTHDRFIIIATHVGLFVKPIRAIAMMITQKLGTDTSRPLFITTCIGQVGATRGTIVLVTIVGTLLKVYQKAR